MEKAAKYYKKALEKYHKGYIDSAIDLCGLSICENQRFKAAASLKGILYYTKGDLENARDIWDFNVRVNKDVVSRKYIENTINDDKLLLNFTNAVHLIEQVKIREALQLLKECEVSDFNVINVSNYIALCFIKQGEYDKAKIYLEKVLSIDKKNKMALKNMKMLREFGIIEKKYKFSHIIAFLLVLLILGTGLTYYNLSHNKKQVKKTSLATGKKVNTTQILNQPTKPEEKPAKVEVFPYNQVKKDIDDLNYDNMYNDLVQWKDKKLEANQKSLLDGAMAILKDKGCEFFYNKGRDYSQANNFKSAIDYYSKVYYFGKSYLFEHSLFYLACSHEEIGNTNMAIKYYEEYFNSYSGGSYEEIVLYNLTMILKNTDIQKSKKYAGILISKYPNSMYNNSNVKNILSK